jgi:Cu-processing system ATP-binding protein
MIETQQLSKRFGKLQALDQISVNFGAGQGLALIGPNGSGKTTFIKCLLGMVLPDEGRILVQGQEIKQAWAYREAIGYMPQIGRYPDNMKVCQVIALMKEIRLAGSKKCLDEELIEAFKLRQCFDKPMRTLSGGTRQKVSAALAFLFNPQILILDEPTAGLDPVSAEALKEKVLLEQQNGKLVLMTSHILNDLEDLCTHVMYLVEGRMLFCEPVEGVLEQTGETRFAKAIVRIMSGLTPVHRLKTTQNPQP